MDKATEQAQHTDSEYETEDETLVHVEVGGILKEDLSVSAADNIKFIHIESSQPIVQIGGQVFAGEFQDATGTSVFFRSEELPEPMVDSEDPVFGRPVKCNLSHVASTRKKLKLKRVFLKQKSNSASNRTGDLITTNADADFANSNIKN